MDERTAVGALERGRDAASRGDWGPAYDMLAEADADGSLEPADLVLLADAAYATGRLDPAIQALERAHAAALREGDRLSAADAAVQVAIRLLMDTGLMAPVRGWSARAERLLEGMDDTPVHAWLAVARIYERLLSGDFPSARAWARRAIEIGTDQEQPGAAALGRVAEARALIFEGDVTRGLELLDEAAVSTMSGELDPMSAGMVYCELLCACQGLAQYDRAEQWTEAMERWRHERGVGSLAGRCRVHRAELLRLRGACAEAELEALQACEELRPYLRIEFGWPLTELGRIRLRTGDLEGAEEAFLAAHEAGWEPQPGLALLRLAQGDVEAASAAIRDALDRPLNVPSKELPPNTELRRAPLLEAQVEIAVAADDLERARWAAGELEKVAGLFESKAISASASLSRGRVRFAEGDLPAARREFDEALRLWNDVGAPYEAAVARVGIAHAYQAEGNEDRARMEFQAARSAFERLGTMRDVDLVSAFVSTAVTENNASVTSGPSSATADVFRCEGDHWLVVYRGRPSRVRDVKGMHYLRRLLADPSREFHVLDLVGGQEPELVTPGRAEGLSIAHGRSDAGPVLDRQAKEAYARRIAEIEDDLAEARAFGDVGRAERAAAEREFLVRELSRAVGLSGRDRRAGSASERARASATQAIRHAMARLRERDSDLGEHLTRAVRTGTYCAYLPDPRVPIAWQL